MMEFDTLQQAESYGRLLLTLQLIEQVDRATGADYQRRYLLVIDALLYARRCGIDAGIRVDPEDVEWPVVFIELPTGQVSWHMPQHTQPWDGHTTEVKYERIRTLIKQEQSALDNL